MTSKEIYFAGGCFWGVEHYFKGVDGVVEATPGYANGNIENPSYEQVYTDTTGFAETVRVRYRPDRVSLETLVRLFFASIDPLSVNRQGHDIGTRYRTGVFYTDPADLPLLESLFAEVAAGWGAKTPDFARELVKTESSSANMPDFALEPSPVMPDLIGHLSVISSEVEKSATLATELLPLRNFYPAEDYHQDYLDKNPSGYCHLPLKAFRYLRLYQDLRLLLGDEPDPIARMANTAAMIYERMKFFWVGFYRVEGEELVLGPFQGPAACFRIKYGKGVCGTAWQRAETVVVPDVEAFPGHIACSALSKSEIVVPVKGEDAVKAVLDIDSTELETFDRFDAAFLELIVSCL